MSPAVVVLPFVPTTRTVVLNWPARVTSASGQMRSASRPGSAVPWWWAAPTSCAVILARPIATGRRIRIVPREDR